jgi:hypothetical protein
VSINSTFDQFIQEVGIKGLLNPSRFSLNVSRIVRLFPYGFIQQNVYRRGDVFSFNHQNTRPGIGVNGLIGVGNAMNARVQCQAGYNLSRYHRENNQGFVFEMKVGVGINTRMVKRKRNTKSDN